MTPLCVPAENNRRLAWLGVAILAAGLMGGACAKPQTPTGGPRDVIPPMIATTWPDTFANIEPTRDPVKINFNERISERPVAGARDMDAAVIVSPVTGEHRVKKTRSGLEIDVVGGFQPDLVYRVRVLPFIQDLFNNAMEGPFELVFSTGAPYEHNVLAGIVTDRLSGEVVSGVRVEARGRGLDDPPVHIAATDTSGVFALRYLPAGAYDVAFYEDVNRNAEADYRELQGAEGTDEIGQDPSLADTVFLMDVQLLRPDTTPAQLIAAEAIDSLYVRFGFDDFLDAEGPLDGVLISLVPEEEGAGPAIERLLWSREVDSIRAIADSIAAEERRVATLDSLQVVADSLSLILEGMETAGDSLGVDTVAPALERILDRLAPPEPPEEEPEPEEEEVEPAPILPEQEFFALLVYPLPPNRLFNATVEGVVNINGTGGGGGEASFAWEPPERPEEEPDTGALVPDTAGAVPDTAGVPPDTSGVPPDTSGAGPDTTPAPPDTTSAPPDTSVIRLDTARIPPDERVRFLDPRALPGRRMPGLPILGPQAPAGRRLPGFP